MGRPQLFPQGKQVSVLVSAEDYRALAELVEAARAERADYCLGDLLRGYIRRGLDGDAPERRQPKPLDPRETHVRQLHALARSAKRIALELQGE